MWARTGGVRATLMPSFLGERKLGCTARPTTAKLRFQVTNRVTNYVTLP